MSRFVKRSAAALATVVLAVVGLAIPVAGAAPTQSSEGKCPLNALKNARSKPADITYWHSMTRANEETLQKLTDKFNSSQNNVHVSLVNQTTYVDTLNKFRAGLASGDLPDLVQIEDTGLQQMIDTQAILPAQACVKADKYGLSDNLKRVVDYYSVKGQLWPVPFNVSNPVLYYNKKAFQTAGLDPNSPPKTLDPWYLEQWSALGGKTYVNNGNGRKSRATSTTFDNATGKEIFTFLNDMVKSGLARTNPAD